ncbi:MAG TPA: hypothetical protein PKC83_15775 [Gemmatimonadaceae bacterium]|nr:hypothetical protein [Gemmatimonadaceae bacterium]
MRRWTLLVIPHDTEQPRSIAISERAVRLAGSAAAVVVLVAAVGIGALSALLSRRGALDDALAPQAQRASAAGGATAAEIDSLRETVRALTGTLDTIRDADARLSAASGVPSADSATLETHSTLLGSRATADSLLRHASTLAGQIDRMADSAGARRQTRTSRGTVATKSKAPR